MMATVVSGLPGAAGPFGDRRFCSAAGGFSGAIGRKVGGLRSPSCDSRLAVKIALPSLRGSAARPGFGSAAGSDGLLGEGLSGGRRRDDPASGPRAREWPRLMRPRWVQQAQSCSLRRDAPPKFGLLGDLQPLIGARSRSRGRRPRSGQKGSRVALDVRVRWMKKPRRHRVPESDPTYQASGRGRLPGHGAEKFLLCTRRVGTYTKSR